ncbi:MAG: YggS family pyridoxal phosphate-dependent enzyme [Parabacteroides sp.]|nr:YggS family pyridoxal phosphate-dependent enzyme [Parabacteroides sp.]
MSIAQNIVQLKASLPANVTLVAVSKFHPAEALLEAYNAGQRVFGESRAQELAAKQKVLPGDIEWHFIGPLQSNKVKDIAPFIHTIHSIDSLKLLREVNKQAVKNDRIIRVLLEIHVAREESKHGLTPDECRELLQTLELASFSNIRICGLMGMATNTDDTDLIEQEFHILHELFTELKATYFKGDDHFAVLSMGMSHDYLLAIRQGSNMIRVGTSIFGEREY